MFPNLNSENQIFNKQTGYDRKLDRVRVGENLASFVSSTGWRSFKSCFESFDWFRPERDLTLGFQDKTLRLNLNFEATALLLE